MMSFALRSPRKRVLNAPMFNLIAVALPAADTTGDTFFELGAMIAVVCSWQRNRSILWAFLAAVFSWIYVIYFAVTRRADERRM